MLHGLRRYVLSLVIILLGPSLLQAQAFNAKEIDFLISGVQSEVPWTRGELAKIFRDPRVQKLPDTVRLNVTEPLRLTDERYKHFTEAYALNLARKFSRRWRTTLAQAAKQYEVDSEVIVAILLVETSFGRFKGNHHLLSVFASTYVESHHMMNSNDYANLAESMQVRIKRRGEWARKELESLLKIGKQHPSIRPFELRGSYAGAFGKAQFLPTSYLNFAVRARDDKSPDLFFEPDAIFSIANYLKGHGYKRGLDRAENRDAIFAYNRSQVYVNVVLAVARALAESAG